MKKLHFKDNITNFIYDLDECITIYDSHLHVFNYQKLIELSSKIIILQLNSYKVEINGNNLHIKKMSKQELLIVGNILKVEFNYE